MYKSLKYSYGNNLAHFSFGESPLYCPEHLLAQSIPISLICTLMRFAVFFLFFPCTTLNFKFKYRGLIRGMYHMFEKNTLRSLPSSFKFHATFCISRDDLILNDPELAMKITVKKYYCIFNISSYTLPSQKF